MIPNEPRENVSLESIAEIASILNELEASVGPLVTLTPEEREEARPNYEKLKEMIANGFEIPSDHPDLADPESDLSKLNAGILRMKQLDALLENLQPSLKTVEKVRADKEKDHLLKALHIYASLELAAKAGLPGAEEAYQELKVSFDAMKSSINEARAISEGAPNPKSNEEA